MRLALAAGVLSWDSAFGARSDPANLLPRRHCDAACN